MVSECCTEQIVWVETLSSGESFHMTQNELWWWRKSDFIDRYKKNQWRECQSKARTLENFFSKIWFAVGIFLSPQARGPLKPTLALNVRSPSSFQPLCCLQVWVHTECLIFSSFQMVTFWSAKNVEENIFYSQNDTFPRTSERITLQIMSPIIPFAKVSRRVCRIIKGITNNKHFKQWVLGKERCRLKCCTIKKHSCFQ